MRINTDSPIMVALTKAFDAVVTTFYFLICCIPIVTMGASLTAMWKTMMAISGDSCSGVTAKFFGAFRSEFKQSTAAWLIMLLLGLILGGNIWVSWFVEAEMAAATRSLFQWITILFAILYICIFLYLFAGIAKFVVTLGQAFSNAFLFAAKYMLQTFLLILLLATLILAIYIAGILSYPAMVLILYLMGCVLRGIFDRHLGIKRNHHEPLGESL